MGFTTLLLLGYLILSVVAVITFKWKHKVIGIGLLLVMVLSILILGYMWIHSPM